ncbi:hypothetical protein B0H11DRAFT_2135729 [Mycena galericulata]|nr:hypothetical protein B0H11DRAFT_2135729 [Mycena galericulata]
MKNTGSPVQEPRKIAGELVAPASTSSAHPVSAASAHFLSPVFSSNSLEPYVSDFRPRSPTLTRKGRPQALLSTAPRAHCIVSDLHCPHHESGAAVSVPHTSPVAPAPATVSEVAPTLRVAPIPPLDLGNGHGAATLNSGLNSADLRDDSGSGGIHIALSQLEVANAIFDAFGALGLSTVMAIPPPPPLPLPASSHGPLPRPSHHTPSADQPPSGHVGHALSGASPRQTPSNRHNFPPSPLSALPLQPLLSHPASLAAPSTTVRHALPREAFPCQNPSNLQVFSASPPLGAGRVRHDLPRGASLRGSGSGFREIGPGPEPNRTPTTLIEQPAPTGNSRLVASSRRAARGTRVDNYHPLKITRGDLGTDLSDARDETAAVADVDLHDRKEHQNLLPPCASTPDPTLQEQNITTSPLEPKRPHTTSSSVERKEARAHRNRIAAQNSRDRRKAQFSYLERRVSELEEENRRLRAGLFAAPAQQDPRKAEEPECEQAKSRENEELRERIKTLEKGWDVVTKALATGLSRMGVEID